MNENEFDFTLDDILKEAGSMFDEPPVHDEPQPPPRRRMPPDDEEPEDGDDERSGSPHRGRDRTPRTAGRSLSKKELREIEREREHEEKELEKQRRLEEKERKQRKRRAARRRRRRRFKIFCIVFFSLLLILAALATFFGIKVTNSPENFPNVHVGDTDVGRITVEQTVSRLESEGWSRRTSTPLVVTTFGGVTVDVDPVATGIVLTADAAARRANDYGRSGNVYENLFSYVKSLVMDVDVCDDHVMENEEYIGSQVEKCISDFNVYMGDSEYVIDTNAEAMYMKKGWNQLSIDPELLHSRISEAVREGKTFLTFTEYSGSLKAPDFDAIHTELGREPIDARYTDDGRFDVIDEIVGCRFDVNAARVLWEQAEPGEEVNIPLDITYPEITGDLLRSRLFGDLLGAMTTRYTNSGENRCSNVRLATSKINGHVLYPGDEFSYNDVVGTRTEAAGFLPAPAYAGVGEDGVKDEIGGGACQVSSTLYASTIFAFLETVERNNHVYPVNYIQLGTDATVTIPEDGGNVMDFKFRNSRNFPIRIVGITNETEEEKTITFEIWGTLEDSDYMPVEFDNSWNWQFDYDRFIEPARTDRPGYKIKLTHETWSFMDALGSGLRTITHREIYAPDGTKVEDDVLNPVISTGYAMDTYYSHDH